MSTTCRDLAGSRLPTPSEHVARAQVADAQTLDIDMMCATRLAFAERAGVTPRVGSAASRFTAAPVPVRRRRTLRVRRARAVAPSPSEASPRAPGRAAHLPHDEGEGAGVGVYEYTSSPSASRGSTRCGCRARRVVRVRERQGWRGCGRAVRGAGDERAVVDFLEERGVKKDDIGALVTRHPPVLAYSVERRLAPLFAYLGELGMDTDQVVENLTAEAQPPRPGPGSEHATHGGLSYVQRKLAGRGARVSPEDALRVRTCAESRRRARWTQSARLAPSCLLYGIQLARLDVYSYAPFSRRVARARSLNPRPARHRSPPRVVCDSPRSHRRIWSPRPRPPPKSRTSPRRAPFRRCARRG